MGAGKGWDREERTRFISAQPGPMRVRRGGGGAISKAEHCRALGRSSATSGAGREFGTLLKKDFSSC